MTDNGTEYILNKDWRVAQRFTLPVDTNVVTIKGGNDPNNVGGILASFSNDVVTDDTWQCADMSLCTSGECESPVTWKDAQTYGVNGEKKAHGMNGGGFKKSNQQLNGYG